MLVTLTFRYTIEAAEAKVREIYGSTAHMERAGLQQKISECITNSEYQIHCDVTEIPRTIRAEGRYDKELIMCATTSYDDYKKAVVVAAESKLEYTWRWKNKVCTDSIQDSFNTGTTIEAAANRVYDDTYR